MAFLCLALAAVLVAPRLAAAAEPAAGDRHAFEKEVAFKGDDGAPADARPQSAWSAFGGFVGYALVIVLLIAGLAVVAKKIVPGARRFSSSDAIQVLGRRNLTPQASLFLIQVGRKVLRVGIVKEGMSYLGEVADADEVALIRGQCLGTNETSAFKEALDSRMPEEKPAKAEEAKQPEPVEEPAASDAVRNELEAIRKVVNGWRASA
jgi:flagellar biogenesis protein FliO